MIDAAACLLCAACTRLTCRPPSAPCIRLLASPGLQLLRTTKLVFAFAFCCTHQPPPQAEAREHDLRQRLAVAELEVRKLTAALEARRRRLADAQRRLQALLP